MPERVSTAVEQQVSAERAFWSSDPFERPGTDSIENLLNKAQDAAIFHELIAPFSALFQRANVIGEVGGGQGWASCLVKRLRPEARVVLTDAAPEGIAGRPIWERVFNCQLDDAVAAPAQQLPFSDGSVDLLFRYAAAHHFVDHDGALREVKRVLAPNGHCLWLYEPTSPRWTHATAERRVNRKRPDVPEHVMIPGDIAQRATNAALSCRVEFCTSTAHRGRFSTLYYTALGTLPVLTRFLPCTAHFVFTHR